MTKSLSNSICKVNLDVLPTFVHSCVCPRTVLGSYQNTLLLYKYSTQKLEKHPLKDVFISSLAALVNVIILVLHMSISLYC